jgi:uncharacterized protein (TIGR00369 family)
VDAEQRFVIELAPGALAQIASAPEVAVVGTGRPCGREDHNSLAVCEFLHNDSVVATATLRSFYIQAPGDLAPFPAGPTGPLPPGSVANRMAVRVAESGGAGKVLVQDADPVLNNSLGIVHGGVSAMALELVGSAAVNENRGDRPLHTASLRINFLRPFHSGSGSRYVGTPVRIGRSSGVADARAVGGDGEVAIIARLTAFR